MADLNKLALVLSGFGAGVQGRLPEFQASLAAQEQQQQKLDAARIKAAAEDNRVGLMHLRNGDIRSLNTLIDNRVDNILTLGGDPSDTLAIKELVNAGKFTEAEREMMIFDREASIRGILEPMEEQETFTPVFNEEGKIVAQRSNKTNKVISDPRSPGEEQETFTPVFNAEGKIVAQRSNKTNKVISDPRSLGTETNRLQFGSQTTVKDENGDLFFATTRRDPRTGKVESVLVPLTGDKSRQPVGTVEQVGALGQTGAERIQQLGLEAKAKIAATGSGERVQTTINEGVDAAQGAAILRRSLELLDSVGTGGFNKVALRAKQLFGVESADEAELSTNLGKAVLSQLRATFGAAFTEREGARLDRIEANFGKSSEGNRRVLGQTLKLVERAAKRGIQAAVDSGDFRAAADIQDLLDFQLSDDDLSLQFGVEIPEAQLQQENEITPSIKFLGFE